MTRENYEPVPKEENSSDEVERHDRLTEKWEQLNKAYEKARTELLQFEKDNKEELGMDNE